MSIRSTRVSVHSDLVRTAFEMLMFAREFFSLHVDAASSLSVVLSRAPRLFHRPAFVSWFPFRTCHFLASSTHDHFLPSSTHALGIYDCSQSDGYMLPIAGCSCLPALLSFDAPSVFLPIWKVLGLKLCVLFGLRRMLLSLVRYAVHYRVGTSRHECSDFVLLVVASIGAS